MENERKSEEFYESLREKLGNDTLWPAQYLYKFIVPTDPKKIEQIEEVFDGMGAVINTRTSAKGNFTSVSIRVKMKNPESVIEKYKKVSVIEGIVSL